MTAVRDRHLTLVVPGLLGPPGSGDAHALEMTRLLCEGLELPSLERFFSRATPAAAAPVPEGLTALLFDCFGAVREGPDWPVAAVTRRVDGAGEDGRCWLRADPVHLRAGMTDLNLLDSESLDIGSDEAVALCAEINAELDDPVFRLQALSPRRWYLSLDEAPRLVTRAPWELGTGSIGEHLPAGEDARWWRARLNDAQMVLHASPVNRAREARGEPAINSLWLWGGGGAPRVPVGRWQSVCGDDPLVAGLADLAGTRAGVLPADGGAWLAAVESPGHHLLVWTAAHEPARRADADGWRRLVSHFEDSWMAPLLDALARGAVHSLRLRCGHGGQSGQSGDYSLGRRGLRRWWRRPKSFARIVSDGGLAGAQHR